MIVHLNIYDNANDSYVEYSTGAVMDFCNSSKLYSTKSVDGDLKIFTVIPKNTCVPARFVVHKDGYSYREELNDSIWMKVGGRYKARI